MRILCSLICNYGSFASLIKKPYFFLVHSNEFCPFTLVLHTEKLSFSVFSTKVHRQMVLSFHFRNPLMHFLHEKTKCSEQNRFFGFALQTSWVSSALWEFISLMSKTAIIANQWMQNSHSKLLTQLVSNAKPTEKKEKPIELRAFSFFQVNKTFSGFRKWKDGAFFHVPYINRTGKRFSFRQKRLRKQGKH